MKLHRRLTDARAFSAGLYSPESLTRYPPTSALYGGPYRARTDDIHGVNVLGLGVSQTEPDKTIAITGISVWLVLADSGPI